MTILLDECIVRDVSKKQGRAHHALSSVEAYPEAVSTAASGDCARRVLPTRPRLVAYHIQAREALRRCIDSILVNAQLSMAKLVLVWAL
jgi:hypothetical protein